MSTNKFTYVCFLSLAISFQAFSQKESLDVDKMRDDTKKSIINWYNITDVKKNDATFEIIYDITGLKDDEYEVTLVMVQDSDPNFHIIPKQVTGKIGVGQFAGENNSIIWNYKKDHTCTK